ncbi:hypothetical protein [Nostoc sp.]|uniref:hypothetical protein n=1 Tax=Nostoc sp. TaxID=1180 RepID=UPI002FFB5085
MLKITAHLSVSHLGQTIAVNYALTAYAREINAKQVLETGFDKLFAKPIEPAELVEAIANLIAE